MKIVFIGTGYVGLVSGTCLAEFGFNVICVDKQELKIKYLKQGKIPIYEPKLNELILRNQNNGHLCFTIDYKSAISKADIIFITVGTSTQEFSGYADLQYVDYVAEIIGKFLQGYTVVVIKSTVPVGTGYRVKQIINNINSQADFDIASNPEFLREGSAIKDFMKPDRIIIGVMQKRSLILLERLYNPLSRLGVPILWVNLETAELIKYAANAFLATKVAFVNEMADFCEVCGADIQSIAQGMGLDSRIGTKFLQPGPGYGGCCFPKDTLALVRMAETYKIDMSIIKNTIKSNDKRRESMVQKIITSLENSIKGKIIAILGVTFKANTDDVRESPSLDIILALQRAGAKIQAFDPKGMNKASVLFKGVRWFKDTYSALENAHFCVILTEWNIFKKLNLKKVKKILREPIVIDLRNLYEPKDFIQYGLKYISIGRSILVS